MSLDFAILGDNGSPAYSVPMNPSQHHLLVTLASAMSLNILDKISDYYEDVEFEVSDLPELLREVDMVRSTKDAKEISVILNDLHNLIQMATNSGKPVHAVAD